MPEYISSYETIKQSTLSDVHIAVLSPEKATQYARYSGERKRTRAIVSKASMDDQETDQ